MRLIQLIVPKTQAIKPPSQCVFAAIFGNSLGLYLGLLSHKWNFWADQFIIHY